ncbi:MAG: GTP-binding protein [Anaerolineae bacterium]
MDLHIVGGFLGSGKTTAIIGAAKRLMARGTRVGVVTNDQGRYLVDTAFFQSAEIPAVEVTGGCFCCSYDDLEAQLVRLSQTAQPDVIFAESVGSCADIVATVVKPLLKLRPSGVEGPTSFSVFADARLLRRRLLGLPMPFSDDVVYLFGKQIEEAGLLVINKEDLLSPGEARETLALARGRYPAKAVSLQNSLEAEAISAWVSTLESGRAAPPTTSLEIDYARYGAGEAELAWLDETLTFTVPPSGGRAIVRRFMTALLDELRRRRLAVGHLKFFIQAGDVRAKVSFPTLQPEGWERQVPEVPGTQITLLVNARVEADAVVLHALVHEAAEAAVEGRDADFAASDVAFFHPTFPAPTHRFS